MTSTAACLSGPNVSGPDFLHGRRRHCLLPSRCDASARPPLIITVHSATPAKSEGMYGSTVSVGERMTKRGAELLRAVTTSNAVQDVGSQTLHTVLFTPFNLFTLTSLHAEAAYFYRFTVTVFLCSALALLLSLFLCNYWVWTVRSFACTAIRPSRCSVLLPLLYFGFSLALC
jgi:hypothetical protein